MYCISSPSIYKHQRGELLISRDENAFCNLKIRGNNGNKHQGSSLFEKCYPNRVPGYYFKLFIMHNAAGQIRQLNISIHNIWHAGDI